MPGHPGKSEQLLPPSLCHSVSKLVRERTSFLSAFRPETWSGEKASGGRRSRGWRRTGDRTRDYYLVEDTSGRRFWLVGAMLAAFGVATLRLYDYIDGEGGDCTLNGLYLADRERLARILVDDRDLSQATKQLFGRGHLVGEAAWLAGGEDAQRHSGDQGEQVVEAAGILAARRRGLRAGGPEAVRRPAGDARSLEGGVPVVPVGAAGRGRRFREETREARPAVSPR